MFNSAKNFASSSWGKLDHRTQDLLITGLPAVGLLATQGDSIPEKIGGTIGGLGGLGAEVAGLNYLDSTAGKALTPKRRLGLQMLTGIAPIVSEMIGSGVGSMFDGNSAHR